VPSFELCLLELGRGFLSNNFLSSEMVRLNISKSRVPREMNYNSWENILLKREV
jgi:hypothetical protein